MKNIIISLLMGLAMSCSTHISEAQEFKEHLTKEFILSGDVSPTTLFVYNISGYIKVEGYEGSKVLIDMDKTISGEDQESLEKGKKEFQLGFEQKSDTLQVFIAKPFDSRPRSGQCNCSDNERHYNFEIDFTIKVPYALNLHVSTINNGMILVNKVNGILNVNNVNGGITITDAQNTTQAHTVNGDITINYLKNPVNSSSYHTINGNIRINYQSDLAADLQFKSMNGEFYTDFHETSVLPATATQKTEKETGKTVYKINKSTKIRFGKGGNLFKFETLNGNVYIKKQS